MLLALTEMQEMIESSVLEFLTHEYDFLKRTKSLEAAHAIAPEIWSAFAEMGWLGLPVPEALGGIGGRSMEVGLLMRAFGRHLVLEPYLNSVLLATRLVVEAGSEQQKISWLPDLLAGSQRMVLAHDEFGNTDPWAPRATRVLSAGNGVVLNGSKTLVSGASGAGRFLVSAHTEQGGHCLVALRSDQPGLQVSPYRSLDGGCAADLVFDNVQLGPECVLVAHADATPVLHSVLAEAVLASCWEASGAMKAVLEQTATYTQERVQFGQPIAKFQVVQHRLAEMAVLCEEALAACQLASLSIERDPATAVAMACLAKSKVGRGARYVSQEAVQLHGAMGVSDELAIASYFRKLLAFTQQHGGTAWFGERYGREMLKSAEWRQSRTLAQ